MNSDGFIPYFLGCISGVGVTLFIIIATLPTSPEPTCEDVQINQWAFQQCLKMRPACKSVTTPDFVIYRNNKIWLGENCPVESGDGSLSQTTE